MIASIPSPSSNGLSLGPRLCPDYGLCNVIEITAAIVCTRGLWARCGDPDLVDPDLIDEVTPGPLAATLIPLTRRGRIRPPPIFALYVVVDRERR